MSDKISRADRFEQAAELLADAVNVMGPTAEEQGKVLADAIRRQHRTLQQSAIAVLIMTLIELGNTPTSLTDARNEASIEMCRKMRKLAEDGEIGAWFPLI